MIIYNYRGNQIEIAQIAIYNYFLQIKSNVGFWREGKTGVPGDKPLIAEERTNKFNPHLTLSAEIEPGPHWWKASALITTPTLPPISLLSILSWWTDKVAAESSKRGIETDFSGASRDCRKNELCTLPFYLPNASMKLNNKRLQKHLKSDATDWRLQG